MGLIYTYGHLGVRGKGASVAAWFGVVCVLASIPARAGDHLVFAATEASVTTLLTTKVLVEAYADLGMTIDVKEFPSRRALKVSSSGEVDGELHRIAGINQMYPDLVAVPVPVATLEIVAFTKGPEVEGLSPKDLIGKRVGTRRGIIAAEEPLRGMNIELTNDYDSLFRMLDKSRIDVAVAVGLAGMDIIKKFGMNDIHMAKPALNTVKLYHYLYKSHQDIVQGLSVVLRRMLDSGRIDEIREEFEAEQFARQRH